MDKAIKNRWVNALRSGEYKQGRFNLYNHEKNTFCCLGVLCDIMLDELNLNTTICLSADNMVTSYDGSSELLPAKLAAIVGSDNPYLIAAVHGRQFKEQITALNDDYDFTFTQLADLIEEQL